MDTIHQNNPSGFILIDKPIDWTSHDVVGYIRGFLKRHNLTDIKRPKVGHAGTLDPFATGLLIVGIGREATKRIDEFKNMPKEYVATIRFGAVSDTYDKTGTITINKVDNTPHITEEHIKTLLKDFVGKQEQIPPMYSAKKIGGKKLYELARKGIEIERKPHIIEIYSIDLLNIISSNQSDSKHIEAIEVRISCSTGTYIRTLAHDIGAALGTGAYCEELRRTRIGAYNVDDAIAPDILTPEYLNIHRFI